MLVVHGIGQAMKRVELGEAKEGEREAKKGGGGGGEARLTLLNHIQQNNNNIITHQA